MRPSTGGEDLRPSDTTNERLSRKQTKANESKIAFIGFLLFSFIFRNRGFSKGYGRKNKKISRASEVASQVVGKTGHALRSLLHGFSFRAGPLLRSLDFDQPKVYGGFWF
jgi:hypothetical protein